MAIRGEYLGMGLTVDDLDVENLEYFRHCAEHDFHLQACAPMQPVALSADHPPAHGAQTLESTWKKSRRKRGGAFLQRGAPCNPTGVSAARRPI